MTSKPCDTDTMDSKNDDDGLSGVFKAPPPTRVQSPMRPVLTGQAPSDLEAQQQPVVSGDRRDKTHWWSKETWSRFARKVCPCCVGRFPGSNKVAYVLFPCCVGSHKRRSDNLGICIGLLLGGCLLFTLVCLIAMFTYAIIKAVKRG
ncbi:hypothetical protein VUR80DRAFT_9357 [Thermomyces stellatus]